MFNKDIATYLHIVCPKATILYDGVSNHYTLVGETELDTTMYLEKTVKKFYDAEASVLQPVDGNVCGSDVTSLATVYTIQKCGVVSLDSHDYIPRWIQAITYVIPDAEIYFFKDLLPETSTAGFYLFIYTQAESIDQYTVFAIVGREYKVLGGPWDEPEPIMDFFHDRQIVDMRLSQLVNVTGIGGVRHGKILNK